MTPLAPTVREALLDALAVLSPIECAGCGRSDRALCPPCRAALLPQPETRMLRGPPALLTVAALQYDGSTRRVILALKESGRTDVVRHLGSALRAALAVALDVLDASRDTGAVELAAIPTSRSAFRRRGYDPVRLLLRRAGFARLAPVLAHTRRTRQQKTLDRDARSSNVAESLRARHPLAGRRFIIVDDVVTTGSTVLEAARAIRAAGGTVVAAVAVAHTPSRNST